MYSNKYLDKIYSNRFEMAGQRGFEPNNNINYFIDYYINTSIDGAPEQCKVELYIKGIGGI